MWLSRFGIWLMTERLQAQSLLTTVFQQEGLLQPQQSYMVLATQLIGILSTLKKLFNTM